MGETSTSKRTCVIPGLGPEAECSGRHVCLQGHVRRRRRVSTKNRGGSGWEVLNVKKMRRLLIFEGAPCRISHTGDFHKRSTCLPRPAGACWPDVGFAFISAETLPHHVIYFTFLSVRRDVKTSRGVFVGFKENSSAVNNPNGSPRHPPSWRQAPRVQTARNANVPGAGRPARRGRGGCG